MLPIKSELADDPPETESTSFNYPPYIKSETIEYPPDVKLESIDEYKPEIPPTKRLKTLSPASPSPYSKGKSKIETGDYNDSSPEQELGTCGVCLLEEGMSLRGFIDSCEHYFCFVCIMEWAKVESRCPICKRRFSTIRRPPRDGVFLSERIVDVPVRDQVHYYNGNATVGPADPYSQVKCSVCSLSTDESLLLLCDLCDSAAHSYCVGLGSTVPEGDWFCQDCNLSRDQHAKVETDNPNDTNTHPFTSNVAHFTQSHVSIHDIVRESSNMSSIPNQNESNAQQSNAQQDVDRTSNARTLKRCLNVHARIKILRENWDDFRGGSLNFSSSQVQESNSQNHSSASPDRGSYNIDRAWKMMDIASKALGRKSGNKRSVDTSLKPSVNKERLLKDASKEKPHFGGTSKNDRFQMFDKKNPTHGSAKSNQLSSSRKIISSFGATATSNVDKRCTKNEINAALKEEGRINKETQLDINTKKLEDAKSEIQSLVKLNLKLLTKDKKLEVGVFKEVARHATHSILGACGIEVPRAGFRCFQRLVCKHEETQKRARSTLMPTSCRECFFVFVKDVVTAIAYDRTGSSKSKPQPA